MSESLGPPPFRFTPTPDPLEGPAFSRPFKLLVSVLVWGLRGLDWLIAPRLYLRTLPGKFAVFYLADPALLAESQRLVRELKAFRGF